MNIRWEGIQPAEILYNFGPNSVYRLTSYLVRLESLEYRTYNGPGEGRTGRESNDLSV